MSLQFSANDNLLKAPANPKIASLFFQNIHLRSRFTRVATVLSRLSTVAFFIILLFVGKNNLRERNRAR